MKSMCPFYLGSSETTARNMDLPTRSHTPGKEEAAFDLRLLMERPEHKGNTSVPKWSNEVWKIPKPPHQLYFGRRTRTRTDLHEKGQHSRCIYAYLGMTGRCDRGIFPCAEGEVQWTQLLGFHFSTPMDSVEYTNLFCVETKMDKYQVLNTLHVRGAVLSTPYKHWQNISHHIEAPTRKTNRRRRMILGSIYPLKKAGRRSHT